MALSSISTMNFMNNMSEATSAPIVIYQNFVFPNDVAGVGVITTHTYNYSGATGVNEWRNGKYLMMSKYNRRTGTSTQHDASKMFDQSTTLGYYMCGIINATNFQFIYSPTTDSVVQGGTLAYTRNSYDTNGNYVGGTTTSSQMVSTNYTHNSSSLISYGEYIEVRFPFPEGFILEKIFVALGNAQQFGMRNTRIVGSNDGINWEQVHFFSFTGTYVQNSYIQFLNITGTNTKNFKSHRVIFETNNGGNIIVITMMRIEGKAGIGTA